jgi:hypothetical protein
MKNLLKLSALLGLVMAASHRRQPSSLRLCLLREHRRHPLYSDRHAALLAAGRHRGAMRLYPGARLELQAAVSRGFSGANRKDF